MERTILIPLDGSAFGEQALPVACSIARRASALLLLAHVHVPGQSPCVEGRALPGDAADMQARAAERAYLEQLARSAAGHDLCSDAVLLDGEVAEALGNLARSSGAELIVMSTHGRGALARVWLGSVAAALACTTPAPLLLVRPQQALMNPSDEPVFRHVLVPLDGSPLAELAIKPAVWLGRLMQAHYTLLLVLDPLLVEHTHPPYAAGLDARLVAEVKATANAYLERVAMRLRAQSLEVQTCLVVGLPAQAIHKYAHTHTVDLIAMATHGRGGVSRLMLGCVADAVVHQANIPILLERPRERRA